MAGLDFSSPPAEMLVFSPQTQLSTLCVNISIIDDLILEDDETLEVSLDVLEVSRVSIGVPSTVTILDDDSKSCFFRT